MFSNFRFLLKSAAIQTAKYPKIIKFENNIFNFLSNQYHSKNPSSDMKVVDANHIDKIKQENIDPYANYPLPEIIVTLDIEGMINDDVKKQAELNMEFLKELDDPITDMNELETESLINELLKKNDHINREFQKNVGATGMDLKSLESAGLIHKVLEKDAQINMEIQKMIEDTIMVLKALKSESVISKDLKKDTQINLELQKNIVNNKDLKGGSAQLNMDIQKLIDDTILVLKALKYESEINKDLKKDVQFDMKFKKNVA